MKQKIKTTDVTVILEEMRAQLADLTGRVARLEAVSRIPTPAAAATETVSKPAAPHAPAKQEITEEEILAVSAALSAYLGIRVHIRQMRLLSSSAWAQRGRVAVQTRTSYTL